MKESVERHEMRRVAVLKRIQDEWSSLCREGVKAESRIGNQ